jgi:glycosyltransferase involved in cell wall biosynthesis
VPGPLKILYHHRTQGRGGEGGHIVNIVRALRQLGHEVDVLSPPGIDPFALTDAAPVDKSQTRTSGLQSLWRWISRHLPNIAFELLEIAYNVPAWFRLRHALRCKHYDVIYERYAFYLVAGAALARRAGTPLVLEANEVVGIRDRARSQTFPRLCGLFESYLFGRAAAVLVVSSRLREMAIARGAPAQKVSVVPNAINLSDVRNRERDARLTARLGLEGSLVIGFAGWFDQWDRLDFLIEVFAEVRGVHGNCKLLLIGDGPALAAARERIEALGLAGAVVVTGAVPRGRVYEYLKLMDAAVLPHSNEFGSPLILFEFMGLGVPVVAPRLPPIEDVLEDERTALLFPPLDASRCAAAIGRLIESTELRRAIGSRATELVERDHTWMRNAERIVACAGRRHSTPSAPLSQ